MKVPFWSSFPSVLPFFTITLLVFFIAVILIPGFFIWIGLKLLGRDVGVIRAGFANFVAVIFASVLAYLFLATPLFFLAPLISFVAYFYALKSLLDVSFIEAFAATIIASIVIAVIAFIMALFFTLPIPRMHIHF